MANCPSCGALLFATATTCNRCGAISTDDNGIPAGLPRESMRPGTSAAKIVNIILIALLLWWALSQFVT